MTHPFGLLRQRNIILQYYVEHSMFIIGQIKCSWLLPHRQAICFSSLIWLSRNKSVKKSRFSRIVKNSREFSLLDLDLEAFWFHFSLLEKEWKHFDFTLHFSKKSESILFSLCTSRKRVKAYFFHFALLEKEWKPKLFTSRIKVKAYFFHFSNSLNPLSLGPALDTLRFFLYWKFSW